MSDDKEYMKALDEAFKSNSKYIDVDDYTCRIFRAGYEAAKKDYLDTIEDFKSALEFYSDLNNWGNEDDSNFKFMIIDDYEDKRPNRKHELYGGRRARDVLEKLKESIEND